MLKQLSQHQQQCTTNGAIKKWSLQIQEITAQTDEYAVRMIYSIRMTMYLYLAFESLAANFITKPNRQQQ